VLGCLHVAWCTSAFVARASDRALSLPFYLSLCVSLSLPFPPPHPLPSSLPLSLYMGWCTRAYVVLLGALGVRARAPQDDIQALHTKVNGNTDKLFAFFRDLLPEEGHANFTKASGVLAMSPHEYAYISFGLVRTGACSHRQAGLVQAKMPA
jgi:hypothetical protein